MSCSFQARTAAEPLASGTAFESLAETYQAKLPHCPPAARGFWDKHFIPYTYKTTRTIRPVAGEKQ